MYDGENAFYNQFGYLTPSFLTKTGQPRMPIKDEVAGENLQSFDNSYITSGRQWGAWNAVSHSASTSLVAGSISRLFRNTTPAR